MEKMVMVKVFPTGQPEKRVKVYEILDDQSNRTLATSELFDNLQIPSEPEVRSVCKTLRSVPSVRVLNDTLARGAT